MSEAKHVRWDEVPLESVNDLLDRQLVVGTQTMIARILLKKKLHNPHAQSS